MKLKYWLMIAFLIVMLLPAAAIYAYYLLLNQLDQKQDLLEYFEVAGKISNMESALQDGSLYEIQPGDRYRAIRDLANDSLKITLYRYDGITLFSSSADSLTPSLLREPNEFLYRHLYELQKNNRTYTIKNPVFNGSKLLGFYEITIARERWLQGVSQRTVWLSFVLVFFFLVLYAAIIYLVHRKISRPVWLLMGQMTSFAQDQPLKPIQHRAKDEIGELIVHFDRMRSQILRSREELKVEQQEKEYIVASLSHDLKTPLTVIRSYTELLQRKERIGDKEREQYFSIVFEKTDYMKQLLDDLSMYAVLRSAHHVMERVEVEGDELFEMLLSGYDELCAKNGIRLEKENCVSGTYSVNVSQMIRIVDNLMNNATRHTNPCGMIGLAAISEECDLPSWVFPPFQEALTEWRKSGVVLLVQNDGESIPAQAQEKVFEPFYQMDESRTKTKTGQSGLGLSIAKIIIDKHGGKIRLWSAPGYGTLVACWLRKKG